MADLLDTDVLLVNRAGVDHSIVKTAVMATVQDTDLLLVNRAGVDYQASYADVKKGFGPQHINPAPGDWTFAPAIAGGTGTQADPFIITPATVNVPGGTVQSAQTLTLTGLNPNDLVEWTDHSTGTGDRFHQLLGLVPPSGQVDLRLNYLDTPNSTTGQAYTGDLQIGTTYFRWVVTQNVAVAPVIGTVTLADSPEAGRFTSGTFATTVTMTEEGIPASTKGLKAWVEGSLKSAAMSSAITNVAGNVLTLTDTTDLAKFAAGDAITEVGNGNDATGTVGSVDTTANTITLTTQAANWDVGSRVKGPLKIGTVTVTPNSDEITNVAGNVLTFKTDKDLAKFAVGDTAFLDSKVAVSGVQFSQPSFYTTDGTFSCKWNSGVACPKDTSVYQSSFDGSTSTATLGDSGKYLRWGPSFGVKIDTSLRVWLGSNNGTQSGSVSVGGVTVPSQLMPALGGWLDCSALVGKTISAATPLEVDPASSGEGVWLWAIEVDGVVLQDGGNLNFNPSGVVASTDPTAKTMTFSSVSTGWSATAVSHHVIGLAKTGPASNVKLYCKLDASLNVTDLQSADPGYTAATGSSPYTLTWPATLPSGNPPDTDLPAGTSLTTEIQATSTGSPAVTKTSNTITPA